MMLSTTTTRLLFIFLLASGIETKIVEGDQSPWAVRENRYRIEVVVEPSQGPQTQTPVGVEIDFNQIFKEKPIEGRLDRDSIRIVEYDPQNPKPISMDGVADGVEIPYRLTGDFPNDNAGRIWWRLRNAKATHFHIYFDSLSNGSKKPPSRMGMIGFGDSFLYNNGQPGPAPIHPLHSQYWHLDWDGDGQRDLIGFAYRRYEYGSPLEKNMGNSVYFLKNIGSSKSPLFAPRYRLKADDGLYLQTELLPQNMFPVDWNRDGHLDFIGVDSRKNLIWWENTRSRDPNQLYVLKHPQILTTLDVKSDFRNQAPGVMRKPTFSVRAINPIDWNGDGSRDLIVSWANTNILRQVDAKKGVIPYGAPLMIFELFEELSNGNSEMPEYAPPRVIMEERGLPLHAACYATGGVAYVDWDGDEDCDILFQDGTNRPLDGGQLMFAENVGSRTDPIFLMPIPILSIDDSPQILDWTGDGLFDLIAGGEFFENRNLLTGGSVERPVRDKSPGGSRIPRAWSHPQLISRGPAQQIQPEMMGHWAASVDWNDDGNLDIVRSVMSHVQLFLNRGTNLKPEFEFGVNLKADREDIYLPNWLNLKSDRPNDRGPQGLGEARHSWLNPTIVDFDRDGDLDLFVTSQRWQTLYFENIGTRAEPILTKGREVQYRGNPQEFSWRSKVSIGDLDGDGKMEMVVTSDEDNQFYAYTLATDSTDSTVLLFDSRRPLMSEENQPVIGWYGGQNNNGDNHSLLVDWDNDGDLDLINGSLRHIYYHENVGTTTSPRFRAHGRFHASGEELSVFRHAGSVDAADWNNDGRLDLMVSTENPSDQPMGEIIHLFDRAFIEGELPTASLGKIEVRPTTN